MTTTNTTPARESALEPEGVVMGLGKVAVGTCVRSTDGVPGPIYLRIPGEARDHDESCVDIFPVGDAAPEDAVLACVYFLTAETVLQSIGTLQQLLAEHFPDAPQSSGNPGPLAAVDELSGAARDVLAERKRQIEVEGWTPARDDVYAMGALAKAAACYAAEAGFQNTEGGIPSMWPWAAAWWKPTNARRDLIKAGALILAEIERLDRAAIAASK